MNNVISPADYVKQFKNSSLEECIRERDLIFVQIKEFEKNPIYTDDVFPSALTGYLVRLDYLKELNELISTKIRNIDPRYEKECFSSIKIRKSSITDTGAEAVVNAANEYLKAGSGVCGAIFSAAGYSQLQEECDLTGHCDTGRAVMTSGFDLCDYVIHAVGPIYKDGKSNEAELLFSCYISSLNLAKGKGLRSIAFPLISSGIYGYPKKEAFRIALRACDEWINNNPVYRIEIIFAIPDDQIIDLAYEETPEPPPKPGKKRKGRKPRGKALSLIDRLKKLKGAVCLFTSNFLVPFDNNQAERDLRMIKAKVKVSGCFRTEKGAQEYLDIMSYVSTAKKLGSNAYEAIRNAVIGRPDYIFSLAAE